jgi:hypothetical protein
MCCSTRLPIDLCQSLPFPLTFPIDNIGIYVGAEDQPQLPSLIRQRRDQGKSGIHDHSSLAQHPSIAQGLFFLHTSTLKYHGFLCLQSCLVDSNWIVKLTNFVTDQIVGDKLRHNELKYMTDSTMRSQKKHKKDQKVEEREEKERQKKRRDREKEGKEKVLEGINR